MGAVCEKAKLDGNAVTQADELNPFATGFNKKERLLLKETWSAIGDAKEIVGVVFMELLEVEPEVKVVFGVQRVPKAQILKMPRVGGHVARFTDHIDSVVHTLGFMDNPLGAWQMVRKVGRAHGSKALVPSLMEKKNYFHLVASHFLTRLLPYMTGEKSNKGDDSNGEKKAVRFAPNYPAQQIESVWERFIAMLVTEMTASFKTESVRQTNQQTLAAIAPHQAAEEEVRRKRRRQQERISAGGGVGEHGSIATSSGDEGKDQQVPPTMDIGDRVEAD